MSLSEQHRNKLYGIVASMEEAGEDSTQIQDYVNQYKSKYDNVPNTLQFEEIPGAKKLRLPEGSTLGSFVSGIGQLMDYYGGAPVRNAIYRSIDNPNEKNPIMEGLRGFVDQYKKSPEEAPTGYDIAKKIGIHSGKGPSGLSHADVVGFLGDIGLDWTNIVPGKKIVDVAFKGVKPAKQIAGVGLKLGDIATGTRIPSTVGKTWAETFETGREAIEAGFSKTPVKSFEESKQIAQRVGIPESELPAAVKHGKHSLQSLFERFEREGPLGQKLRNWWENGSKKLEEGITSEVEKFGVPTDMASAGAQMQGFFDKGLDKYFDQFAITHNNVIKGYPGLKPNAESWSKFEKNLNGLEKWAVGQMKRGFTDAERAQAEQIFRATEAIRESKGSYKQLYETLRRVGDTAFKAKNTLADVTPDTRKFKKLYHQLRGVLEETIKNDVKDGEFLIKPLKENNAKMSAMFKDKEAIGNIMGNPNIGTERKFTNMLGDTRKIKALKTFVEPEDLNKLKSSYLENQIIQRAEDGNIRWQGMSARLRAADRKGILNELFDKGELDSIRDYIKLSNRYGEDVLSRSGTGASAQFIEYLKNTSGRIAEGLVVRPIQNITSLPKRNVSEIAPIIRTPKEYARTPAGVGKVAQTYSTQRESGKRKEEKNIMSEYHGVDLSSAPYNVIDRLITLTKKRNEMEEGKVKNLYSRTIDRLLKQYGGN